LQKGLRGDQRETGGVIYSTKSSNHPSRKKKTQKGEKREWLAERIEKKTRVGAELRLSANLIEKRGSKKGTVAIQRGNRKK